MLEGHESFLFSFSLEYLFSLPRSKGDEANAKVRWRGILFRLIAIRTQSCLQKGLQLVAARQARANERDNAEYNNMLEQVWAREAVESRSFRAPERLPTIGDLSLHWSELEPDSLNVSALDNTMFPSPPPTQRRARRGMHVRHPTAILSETVPRAWHFGFSVFLHLCSLSCVSVQTR